MKKIIKFEEKEILTCFEDLFENAGISQEGESYAHRDKINLIYPNKKPYDYGVYRKNN